MNRPVGFYFLMMCMSFAAIGQNDQKATKTEGDETGSFYYEPYRLNIQLLPGPDDQNELLASIELDSGFYFVSPYSSTIYSGYFNIKIQDDEWLSLDSSFVESPRSMPTPDRWQGGTSHFVEQTTTYTYRLNVNSSRDFKVLGMVSFVIEPRCTLEEIPFSISMKDGEITVQQYPKLDTRNCPKKVAGTYH